MKDLPEGWLSGAFEKPTHNGVLIKSLGKFPFWRGEIALQEAMENIYEQASKRAIEIYDPKKS